MDTGGHDSAPPHERVSRGKRANPELVGLSKADRARRLAQLRGKAERVKRLKGACKSKAEQAWATKVLTRATIAESQAVRQALISERGSRDVALNSVLALPVVPLCGLPVAVISSRRVKSQVGGLLRAEDIGPGVPILNDERDARRKEARDLSRRMHAWSGASQELRDLLLPVVRDVCTALECHVVGSSMLSSVPPRTCGTQRARQTAHTDYCKGALAEWTDSHPGQYPWTLLFALSDHGRIFIRTAKGGDVVVLLRAGEALLFRGDVLHGGMNYSVVNVRAHFYLEPLGSDGMRNQDDELALHGLERITQSADGMVVLPKHSHVSGAVRAVLGAAA